LLKPELKGKIGRYYTQGMAEDVNALKNGQIDGIVVDLPTAFYMSSVQVPNGIIVGQLPPAGEQDRFGVVLEQGQTRMEGEARAILADRRIAQLFLGGALGAETAAGDQR